MDRRPSLTANFDFLPSKIFQPERSLPLKSETALPLSLGASCVGVSWAGAAEISEEATILADGYVSRGIFHRKYIANALHVAVASVNKADMLVTWDFGYIANVHRQSRIQLFNTVAGFFVPMIITPEFLINAEF